MRKPEESIVKALVIDDSRTVRSILRPILEGLGFSVEEAADGCEGLTRLADDTTVVLCDWDMPSMNGIQFVRAARARFSPEPGPRVVMVTKNTRLRDVTTALAAGADEYLMKPFTREMVVEKLALVGIERQ